MTDPNDFIITKKRKKYKFAQFANSPLCFEFDEWQKRSIEILEVGAGTGMFSVEQATIQPEKQFVAVDVKADRLQKGAYEAEARGLINIQFVRARADQLRELFTDESVEQLWLTFPDPFPRRGSARRRLTHPTFLAIYRELLEKNGALYFKTDARELFLWTLEQLVEQDWHLQELSFDLHGSTLNDYYKITTTYEKRWIAEGIATNFVKTHKLKTEEK